MECKFMRQPWLKGLNNFFPLSIFTKFLDGIDDSWFHLRAKNP